MRVSARERSDRTCTVREFVAGTGAHEKLAGVLLAGADYKDRNGVGQWASVDVSYLRIPIDSIEIQSTARQERLGEF
jgi:hypothetical protein